MTTSPSDPAPVADSRTVRELIALYLENLPVLGRATYSDQGRRDREQILRGFVATFGETPARELTRNDLISWIAEHKEWRSAWTRKRVSNTIQAVFNGAAENHVIERNPLVGLKLPKGPRGRDLSDAEFRALLRVSLPHFRRILVFLRFSGARPGEARALTWAQINLESKAVIQLDHKTSGSTGRPRRIPLCAPLVKLLIWMSRRRMAHGDRQFVFRTMFGKQWKKRALCSALERARARASLPADVKLYGCRHAYATGAVMNGLDVATLAQLMGHQSTRTTEVYLHLVGKAEWLESAAEKAVRGHTEILARLPMAERPKEGAQ